MMMFRATRLVNTISKRYNKNIAQGKGGDKIIIRMDVTQRVQVAQALANRIQRELTEVELNVSKSDEMFDSADPQFTVMITDQTMNDGILKLRYRVPKVTEEVHVTSLSGRLIQLTKGI